MMGLAVQVFMMLGLLMSTVYAQHAAVYKDVGVTNFFKKETGCIAGDGGFTIPLSNNKVLWLMGDSHIDDYDQSTKTTPCLFQVRNAAMLQSKDNWNTLNTATLTGNSNGFKSYLKNNANDTFFCWPGAGIQLKDSIYIYCSNFKNDGTGAFGFAVSGNDFIASAQIDKLDEKKYRLLDNFNEISFGAGVAKSNDGKWIYLYGQKYTPAQIKCDLYIARFSTEQPYKNIQYWDGKDWNNDVQQATIIASQTGVSGTFHVSKVNNTYLLLSSALSINCDSGTEIFAAVADDFAGPFSNQRLLYKIDDSLDGHTPFFYAAIAHPEYINKQNELLITYAINGYGTCVPDCRNGRMDPDVYRLRGIRVPVSLISSISESKKNEDNKASVQ